MFGNFVRLLMFTVSLLFVVCFFSLPDKASADTTPSSAVNILQLGKSSSTQNRLVQKRDQAAIKGLQWMDVFLDGSDHFKTMPFETFQFFHVCALTSANPRFQSMAQRAADKYANRLKAHCLAMSDPMERYDFLQLLEFISKREYCSIDFTELIDKAKKNYALYKNTADLYGTPIGNLAQAEWKTVYETLLYAYFLEKADVEYPGVFSVNYRLTDILKFLQTRKYVNFSEDISEAKKRAISDTFIITHIVYMLSNYSSFRLREEDAPWLYDYLRRNFDDILAMGHTDLIGECIDIFRGLGYTEENCDIVRKGTDYLLERQNAEGAWNEGHEQDGSAYDSMHPTSCAIWALRTRTFLSDSKYERRSRRILEDLNWAVKKTSDATQPP